MREEFRQTFRQPNNVYLKGHHLGNIPSSPFYSMPWRTMTTLWLHSFFSNFSKRMLGYCVPLSSPRPIRAHYFPVHRTQASYHPNSTVNIRYSSYSVVKLLGCIFINPPRHSAAVQLLFLLRDGEHTFCGRWILLLKLGRPLKPALEENCASIKRN